MILSLFQKIMKVKIDKYARSSFMTTSTVNLGGITQDINKMDLKQVKKIYEDEFKENALNVYKFRRYKKTLCLSIFYWVFIFFISCLFCGIIF